VGAPGKGGLGDAGTDSAEQIEEQVRQWAHAIFDVCAKNPEKPHVADDVQPAPVEEHAGEQWNERLRERVAMAGERELNFCGDHGVGVYENLRGVLRERDLVDEDRDVNQDEEQRNDGEGAARC